MKPNRPLRLRVSTSSEGYNRVYVGRGHPIADKSGMAYVHRLVEAAAGENVVGRTVHHENERKTSNHRHNLKVETRSEHSSRHAKRAERDRGGRFAKRRRA